MLACLWQQLISREARRWCLCLCAGWRVQILCAALCSSARRRCAGRAVRGAARSAWVFPAGLLLRGGGRGGFSSLSNSKREEAQARARPLGDFPSSCPETALSTALTRQKDAGGACAQRLGRLATDPCPEKLKELLSSSLLARSPAEVCADARREFQPLFCSSPRKPFFFPGALEGWPARKRWSSLEYLDRQAGLGRLGPRECFQPVGLIIPSHAKENTRGLRICSI